MENLSNISAQFLSIIGSFCAIISFQFEGKKMYITQIISALSFSLSYFMLGAYTASLSNCVNILRGAYYSFFSGNTILFFVIILLYVLSFIITYNGWLSVVAFIISIAATLYLNLRDEKKIRICQISIGSPLSFIYNIANLSIGGLINDVFSTMSAIIYLLRKK